MIHSDLSLDDQVTVLRAYRVLYYHTGEWIITDGDYDELEASVRSRLPEEHTFLSEVGAPALNKVSDEVMQCVNWLVPNAFKTKVSGKPHKNFHIKVDHDQIGSAASKTYAIRVWCWYETEWVETEDAAKAKCAELFKRLKKAVKALEDVK